MKLWPIESYEIESPLSVADVAARLQSITGSTRSSPRQPIARFFEGRVTDAAFAVRPVIYSGASFLPDLHGSFESHAGGTLVRVEATPSRAALTIVAALVAFSVASIYDSDTPRVLLTTGSFALLGWMTALTGFWLDGDRARKKLAAALLPSAKPEKDEANGPSDDGTNLI